MMNNMDDQLKPQFAKDRPTEYTDIIIRVPNKHLHNSFMSRDSISLLNWLRNSMTSENQGIAYEIYC